MHFLGRDVPLGVAAFFYWLLKLHNESLDMHSVIKF